MENALYIGMSRHNILQTSMDMVANNLANMNTSGYRAQNPLFEEYLSKPKGQKDALSFVLDYGQYDTTKAGPVQVTGGTFDLALNGPGFFGVNTAEGVQYTRGGNFTINNNGELVTAAGFHVASENGGLITVPEDAKNVKIHEDGTIVSDGGILGKIMIHEFANVQTLEPQGNSLYKSETPGTVASETRALQGYLEGSNVQPIVEMTRMINILRDYQSTQNFLKTEHDRQRGAIERLGRTS